LKERWKSIIEEAESFKFRLVVKSFRLGNKYRHDFLILLTLALLINLGCWLYRFWKVRFQPFSYLYLESKIFSRRA